jgi:hypothetical protein
LSGLAPERPGSAVWVAAGRLRACRQPAGILGWNASSAARPPSPSCTVQGYRRFRCRDCGRQSNERSGGLFNRAQYLSDVVTLVVLWRLRCRLTLRDLSEMFLERGIVFSHDAVRGWEAKLAPVLAGGLGSPSV